MRPKKYRGVILFEAVNLNMFSEYVYILSKVQRFTKMIATCMYIYAGAGQ